MNSEMLMKMMPVEEITAKETVVFQIDENRSFNISVTPIIGAAEMTALFQTIVDLLYDEEGQYQISAYEYIWRRCIFDYYTDIELPERYADAYPYIYSCLWDCIIEHINPEQLAHVDNAVTDYVQRRTTREDANAEFKRMMNDFREIASILQQDINPAEWLSDKADDSPLIKAVK